MKRMENNYEDLLNREALLRYYASSIQTCSSEQTSSLRSFLLTKDPSNIDTYRPSNEKTDKFIQDSFILAKNDGYNEQLKKLTDLNRVYRIKTETVLSLANSNLDGSIESAIELATHQRYSPWIKKRGILLDSLLKCK
jgi:CHASE3 domain sensor protein